MLHRRHFAAALLRVAAAAPALAAWPDKPIRSVATCAAGGAGDIVARAISEQGRQREELT
jgi:tripartite-type tricarboxylate transporter receptor subunit TctC